MPFAGIEPAARAEATVNDRERAPQLRDRAESEGLFLHGNTSMST
jgi:hypothetical protein